MSTTLGIDLGTQHLKAVAYDSDARKIIASASSELELRQREDGTAEQDTNWWIDALGNAMSQLDRSTKSRVVAIGVSGQQHGFVALGSDGDVLSPVKLWCDTSTQPECEEITEVVGGDEACIRIAGNPVLPGYTASKVLWLKKNRRESYDKTDCILLPHDYLNFYLTGERCMEAGDASGTGFFDVRKRTWSNTVLEAIDSERDLRDCLPPLRLNAEIIGSLRPEIAETYGLTSGIPVSTGGGDNMMAAIGTRNVTEGQLTISLGTSGTVYAYSDRPVIDPRGEIAAFCSSTGGWLPLMCTMNCTVSTELMRKLLSADIDEFESRVSKAPRGAGGILTLPYFNGERTPNLPRGKGCIVGLDSQNASTENLLRSAMEGATFALRVGIDRLGELGIDANEIVITGGGANSATWRQLIADVCDSRVTVLEQSEGAALGAALQALSVLAEQPLTECVRDHLPERLDLGCEPNDQAVALYRESFRAYQAAANAITPLYE